MRSSTWFLHWGHSNFWPEVDTLQAGLRATNPQKEQPLRKWWRADSILCLHRFSEIQTDSQRSRARYLHGANWLWLFVRANLACSKAGQTWESSTSRISCLCHSYACTLWSVSFAFESDSFQPVVLTGTWLEMWQLWQPEDLFFASSVENQLSSFRLTQRKRSATILTRLSPVSSILKSKGDTNDTSCICSSPFQPRRHPKRQDYLSRVQLFIHVAALTMPYRLASRTNLLQICSRQVHGFSALPSTIKNSKAFGFACTCLRLYSMSMSIHWCSQRWWH